MGTILLMGVGKGTVSSAFTGPGDIVSGASAFYGLQAYTAAYASGGNPCLDLNNDGTGVFAGTVNFLSSGLMDASTASSLIAGGASRVSKVYDHTGNGRHQLQSNNGLRPQLQLTGLNGGPGLFFDLFGRADTMSMSGTVTIAQPNSYVAVAAAVAGVAGAEPILGDSAADTIYMGYRGSSANAIVGGGATEITLAVNTAIHSWLALASGASSFIQIDTSASSTGNTGTSGYTGSIMLGGDFAGGSWNGYIGQACLYPSDISSSFGILNTNQHTNWNY
jgi:hypothetical protein